MQPVPTLMILPSPLPTATPTVTDTPVRATDTATVTTTPTLTPTLTASATITETALPTATNTPTATATPLPTVTPVADARVTNEEGVNLRSGPSVYFQPPLQLLERGTLLDITAISTNGEWYQVNTKTGTTGWVYKNMIALFHEKPGLPVVDVPLPTLPPPPPPSLVGGPLVLNPPVSVNQGGVISVPAGGSVPVGGGALPINTISGRVTQIYQVGLSLGNNPRMFVKVGDSITATQPFMIGFGTGEYNLGGNGYLQDTVNYFSSTAYTRSSIAAAAGFNTSSVTDPIFAPAGICLPNETPLACEYRLNKPSIAIIMLGSSDIQFQDAEAYRQNMSLVIQQSIDRGVIPVVTTFTNGADYFPDQAEAYNNVLRSLAAQEQIPLIDFRPLALGMPGRGVIQDQFHLSGNGTNYINLNGEQNQYGMTLRNLLTIQMLDTLRRSLGMN